MAKRILSLKDIKTEEFTGEDRLYSWKPEQKDIDRIVSNLKKLSDTPNVLDVGCGSGLVSYLLAKEGCNVTAIDRQKNHPYWIILRNQDLKNLRLIGESNVASVTANLKDFDAVYCSWMPFGKNWASFFYKEKAAPMVIHVIGENREFPTENNDYETETNKTASGLTNIETDDLIEEKRFKQYGSPYQIERYPDYRVIDAWRIPDFRTLGEPKPQKLSKIRIDVRKELADRFK